MQTYKLSLKRRQTGKAARKAVSDREILGVVYGQGLETTPLIGDYRTVKKILDEAGTSRIIKLDIDGGEPIDVLVKDLDHEPVSNTLRHFDLLALKKGEKIDVEIPVVLTGEAPAAKLGHVVHQLIDNLEVRTTPDNIPESIEVDISNLSEVGDTIHVNDLKFEGDLEIEEGWLEQPIVKIDEVRELEVEDTTEEVAADDVPSEHGEDEEEDSDGEPSSDEDKPKSEDDES